MGGQLIKGYSIEGQSLGPVGLLKSWKLFKGHKSGAQTSASIFLIQKKQLKKQEKEEVIKVAKKQSSSLLRVRHPGVLAVIQPLTEDENILAFVAERVEGNFTQLIKHNKLQEFITSQLQLKLYLYPFVQAISFIHDSLKQAHLAISFDNIYLNAEGKWKLAGFGNNQNVSGDDLSSTQQKIFDMSFTAPELALQKQFCKKSDVFSLGMVIINLLQYIYKTNKPIHPINDKNDYQKHMGHTRNVNSISVIAKSRNPVEFEQFIRSLLNWNPHQRCGLSQILQSGWMNDSTLITVKYLDKISSYENKQQLEFLKGLAGVLDDFQIRVVIKIIIPKLLDLLKFNHLIASIIFILIDLLKKSKLSTDGFRKQVWPSLKTVTQGKQITAQAIYLIVYNLQILQKHVGQPDSSTHLMPLYIKCFECPQKLKQLALTMLQKISKKTDYQFMKTKILPKLILLLKDPNIDIRKDALKALYSIINSIDMQTLSLAVLPALQAARKMGSDPLINAIINRMYNIMTQSLSSDVISTKILPVLIPYLTQPSINRYEFGQFKSTIVKMIDKIQKERQKGFQNSPLGSQNISFVQSDFKFKEQDLKIPEQKKGNYNFLANYVQSNAQKIQNTQAPIPHTENTNFVLPTPAPNIHPYGMNSNQTEVKPSPYMPNIGTKTNESDFLASFNISTHPNTEGRNVDIPKYVAPQIYTREANPFNFNNNPYNQLNFSMPQQIKMNKPFDLPLTDNTFAKKQIVNQKPQFLNNPPMVNSKSIKEQQKSKSSQIKSKSPPANKEFKIMGGASGPMEIKKFVGPPAQPGKNQKPSKKQPQVMQANSIDYNYFDTNKYSTATNNQANIFQFNVGQYDIPKPKGVTIGQKGQSKQSIKPISKPIERLQNMNKGQPNPGFTLNDNYFGSTKTQSNPFAELQEAGYGPMQKFVPIKVVAVPKIQPQQSNDIYSYFQNSVQSGSDKSPNAPKNSFQLI